MKNFYTLQKTAFAIGVLFSFFSYTAFAQVGIETEDPKTALDVNGALSLREGPALILGNGNNHNIDLGSPIYSHYRITGPTAAFEIRTFLISPPATVADGQLLTLINTTNHEMKIMHELGSAPDLERRILCPGGKDLLLYGINSTVTFQYNYNMADDINREGRWVVVSYTDVSNASPIDSVSLEEDIIINTTGYNYIDGMELEFTARKPSVLVSLSASGDGEIDALSRVFLQVVNTTDNPPNPPTVGATNQNIQSQFVNLEIKVIGGSIEINEHIANWSASMKKLLTGLEVGKTYTLQVQGRVTRQNLLGDDGDVYINALANPDEQHLTLSVIQ